MINDRAIAVIYKNGEVLMWWRYKGDWEGYVFPGGTNEEGEKIEKTLEREVFEELNLKIKSYEKIFENIHKHQDKRGVIHPRTEHYFLITEFEGEIKLGAPELFRQDKDNIYRPDWIKLRDLKDIEYEPKEVFNRIIEIITNKNI